MPNLSVDLELLADWCAAAFPEDDHRRRPLLAAINSMIPEAARLEWSAGERVPAPPSLAARDVALGECWAFREHRSLAEIAPAVVIPMRRT